MLSPTSKTARAIVAKGTRRSGSPPAIGIAMELCRFHYAGAVIVEIGATRERYSARVVSSNNSSTE
jgi:hypothetical protein